MIGEMLATNMALFLSIEIFFFISGFFPVFISLQIALYFLMSDSGMLIYSGYLILRVYAES